MDFHDTRMAKLSRTSESHLPMVFKISRDQRVRKKRFIPVDAAAEATVEILFNKRFEIRGNFSLPEADTMFTENAWRIESLQSLKRDLNNIKSMLNDYNLTEWSHHTKQRNKAGEVQWRLRRDVRPEFLTQAWCKFYENVCSFPLISKQTLSSKKLRSVHLCEAPGAFVASLNHWLKTNASEITWDWLATTLNPHYEGNSLSHMVNVDHLIIHTPENWFFGLDNTGNLMNLKNLDALVARAGSDVSLITADGSIDCFDTPAEQEEIVSHLHYCETVAALHMLEKGGNFLLKIFTIFDQRTVCLIYLLSCCFERIVLNKPVTSKEGNSEVYVVCLEFAGSDRLISHVETLRRNYENPSNMAMFRKNDIPDNFLQQIVNCGDFFKAHQCEVILGNIRTFRGGCEEYFLDADMRKIKGMVADRFMSVYKLCPLASEEMEIVGKSRLALADSTVVDFRNPPESYNSRRERESLDPKERLTIIADDLNSVAEPDSGNTFKWDSPVDLCLTTGKPYEKIESSKFCAAAILKMYTAAIGLANEMTLDQQIPSSEAIEEFVRENGSVQKVFSFGYTNATNSHRLITKVCDALTNLEKNQNLVFLGYSMLSQLNVGLLYLLARTFDSLEIKASEQLGCIVILKDNKKVGKIAENFSEISKASSKAKLRGEAVLSILPIGTLCACIFISSISITGSSGIAFVTWLRVLGNETET